MKVINKLAIRLKELRNSKGISQEKFANDLGYTQACVSKWEAGTREPSLNDLMAIAIYFETTADYLLGLTDL